MLLLLYRFGPPPGEGRKAALTPLTGWTAGADLPRLLGPADAARVLHLAVADGAAPSRRPALVHRV